MSGSLTLIPTPLKDDLPLAPVALALLQKVAADPEALILVEEHKIGRRRWLQWGLPRESIERFILFNEHTAEKLESEIIAKLKAGAYAVLMSDGGLPAFCDPGQGLVDRAHDARIKVTSTPFENSVALTIALSGFSHSRFLFAGFIPQKDPERSQELAAIWKTHSTIVLMETPYRRQKLLEELIKSRPESQKKRRVFMALELGSDQEILLRGSLEDVLKKAAPLEKLEFVLAIDQVSVN